MSNKRHHTDEEYRRARRNLVLILLAVAALMLLSSCKQTEYVTVPEVHEQHHWHTDSVHKTDSVIHEKETTIMQVDSATMAKYGIQLKSAERAWLVRTAELERQIERLEAMSAVRDTVHDSIPAPFPKIEYVPAEIPWYKRGLMMVGIFFILLVLVIGAAFVIRKKLPI